MRSVLAAAAFAALAAGATAQDKPADKYESKDGKYAVAFPGKPKITASKVGEGILNIATVEKGGGGYIVIYSDLPAGVVKAAKPKEILEGGEKGLAMSFGAKVTSSKETEFGKMKYPAREIVAEKDGTTLRVVIILADNRLYQVLLVGPKGMTAGKDADAFFESFEIT